MFDSEQDVNIEAASNILKTQDISFFRKDGNWRSTSTRQKGGNIDEIESVRYLWLYRPAKCIVKAKFNRSHVDSVPETSRSISVISPIVYDFNQ